MARAERLGGLIPIGDVAHELLGPGGQLGFELGEAERGQHAEGEVEDARDLGPQLLARREQIAVVLL